MKKTHKFRALGDVAAVVRSAPSVTAAARQLGVNRSTLHRWIEGGKVPRPAGRAAGRHQVAAGPRQATGAWASWVRRTYALSGTEAALVDLAEQALALARTKTAKDGTRLTAMGRFQALTKQLDLEEAAADGKAQATTHAGAYPRAV